VAPRIILAALAGLVIGAFIDPESGLGIAFAIVAGVLAWGFAAGSRRAGRPAPQAGRPGGRREGGSQVFSALREAVRRGDVDRETYSWLVREAEEHVRGLLREWWTLGQLDEGTYTRLIEEIGAPSEAPATPADPTPSGSVAAVAAAVDEQQLAPVRDTPVPAAPEAERPAPEAPSRASQMLEALRSDVALHGLAYLGVLLMFAGTAGLVIFAFAEVRPALRPAAEAAIPLSLFGAAWFVRRRGIRVASRGFELLGATLLPLVVFASFVDDAPVPPDLEGVPLLGALVLSSLGLAGMYRWLAGRRPASIFPFMVAPMLWVAAGMAALVWRGDHVAGAGIRIITTDQMATVMGAIVLTLLWPMSRRGSSPGSPAQVVAAIVIPVVYVMGLLAAAAGGWPVGPLVVLGALALVALELSALRLPGVSASLLQWGVAAVTIGALAPRWGVAAAGAAGALAAIGLLEWQAFRRPLPSVKAVGLGALMVGLVAALAEPRAALVAFGASSLWAHLRRPTTEAEERTVLEVASVVAPAGFGYGLLSMVRPGPAVLALGASTAVLAGLLRARRVQDRFWAWWLPVAAVSVVALTLVPLREPPVGYAGAAAALAATALALGPGPGALRAWLGVGSFGWALTLGMQAGGVSSELWPVGWSAVGFLAVAWASVRGRGSAEHLAWAGHLAAFGALVTSLPGTKGLTLSLGGWTAAWLITVVAHERGASPLIGSLARALGSIRVPAAERVAAAVPGLVFAVSVPFLVVESGGALGLLEGRRAWAGLALAGTSLGYAWVARALAGRRPLSPILATGAVLISAVAVAVTAPERGPMMAAAITSVGVVGSIGGRLRRPAMTWFAWVMTATISLLGASLVGVTASELHLVLMAWGAVLLIGGLGYDDLRSGRRAPGEGLRDRWLGPPVCVGALGIPVGLAFAFTGSIGAAGRWSLAASAFYLMVALLLRAGAVAGVAAALGAFGAAALSPVSPMEQPEVLVPITAALVGVSWSLGRLVRRVDPWQRWDLPILVVAHGVAAVALARAPVAGAVPRTWVGFALLSLLVAAWLRRWQWVAGAGVLVVVAAAAAGTGWLALALSSISAGSSYAATRVRDARVRAAVHASSVLAAGVAWVSFLAWIGWSGAPATVATALVSGGAGLAVAALVRARGASREWVAAWGTLAVVGVVAAWGSLPDPTPRAEAFGMAGGMAMLACAAGLAARPTRWSWLREVSSGVLLGSAMFAVHGLRLGPETRVLATVGAGLAATVTLAGLGRVRPGALWLRPIAIFGVVATGASVALAADLWPRRDLLVLALLAGGAEAAAVGFALRRTEPLLLSPLLLCAGYLLFAEGSFANDPNWFTVPIGFALLLTVELGRGAAKAGADPGGVLPEGRAWRGLVVHRELALLIEYLGMAILVGASLVETVTSSLAFGILSILFGTALALWGIVTQVRRRALFGAAVVVLSVVLILGVPLAQLIPTFTGAALWIAVAAIGAVLVLVASFLEQGRAKIRSAAERLGGLMEGWE
jgi:hypothetical protein